MAGSYGARRPSGRLALATAVARRAPGSSIGRGPSPLNTPAHIIANLALLGGGERRRFAGPVLWGALLPDLPMFVFYAWQRASGQPELRIWRELYFDPDWQLFFDLFNSIPLVLLGLGVALAAGQRGGQLLFASALLHFAGDLPFHREDGHRHLFPVSDWRFMSPVSYWDPAHHGALFAAAETALVGIGAAVLWQRHSGRVARGALLLAVAASVSAYVALYMMGVLEGP